MTAEFEPQALHVNFVASHQEFGDDEPKMLDFIKERIVYTMANELAKVLYDSPGGVVLTPVTFTINDDDLIGATRVVATVNAQRLPDPDEPFMRLRGGRMHDRVIRVGTNPPSTYLIPYVAPVSYYSQGPSSLILEYRRMPGTTLYDFVRDYEA